MVLEMQTMLVAEMRDFAAIDNLHRAISNIYLRIPS